MAEEVLMLHWETRDARIKGRPSKRRVDIEIIQERHHAINWLIGYDGLDWDEVPRIPEVPDIRWVALRLSAIRRAKLYTT